MPSAKNPDLHGNVPDKAQVALIPIDVINDLEFPEAVGRAGPGGAEKDPPA